MKIQPFLSHLRTRKYSPETLKAYETDRRLFEQFLKEKRLRVAQLKSQTPSQLAEYLAGVTTIRQEPWVCLMLQSAVDSLQFPALMSFCGLFKWDNRESSTDDLPCTPVQAAT